jgi:adenylate cyclase
MIARLNLQRIFDLLEESESPTNLPFLVNRGGDLIAHPDLLRVQNKENWSNQPMVKVFMQDATREEGYPIESGEGDQRKLAVFHRVPGIGWAAFVQNDYRNVLTPIRQLRTRLLMIAVGLGILFWIVGYSLVNNILRPLHSLQEGIQRIGKGELSHRIDLQRGMRCNVWRRPLTTWRSHSRKPIGQSAT